MKATYIITIFVVVYFLSSLKYALVASFVSGLIMQFIDKKPVTNAIEDQMCDENALPHPLEACDGKEDADSLAPIDTNEGICMNGRCYSVQTLLDMFDVYMLESDPIDGRPFSQRHMQLLRLFRYLNTYLYDHVHDVAYLAQYFALLRQLRAALLLFQMRNNWHQGDYPIEIIECQHRIQFYRRKLGIHANLINATVTPIDDDIKNIAYQLMKKIHIRKLKDTETYMPWIEDINLNINSREKVINFLDGYLRFVEANENEPFTTRGALNMDGNFSISMDNYDEMIAFRSTV